MNMFSLEKSPHFIKVTKKEIQYDYRNKLITSKNFFSLNATGTISEIIDKHRHLSETDDTLKQLLPKNSIIVANKRGRSLLELLTRADS